ncbi:hypothetical protein [Blastochloris sulfoviridis]|nr:hypothetical protein [Blastochloris sulfoviridis]
MSEAVIGPSAAMLDAMADLWRGQFRRARTFWMACSMRGLR